ncbi:hypothetical protein H5410_000920, partial [Solanum commersonii]
QACCVSLVQFRISKVHGEGCGVSFSMLLHIRLVCEFGLVSISKVHEEGFGASLSILFPLSVY